MRSALPKVMHKIGGLPMVGHVMRAAKASGAERIAVVVGSGTDAVRQFIAANAPDAAVCEQTEQLGTAHAVLAAGAELKKPADDILILYGDTPLVGEKTLGKVRKALAKGADLVVLGFHAKDPTGYGRLIEEKGRLVAIREDGEANKDEKATDYCNAGVMAFTGDMVAALKSIKKNATKGEYYLTDLVAIGNRAGKTVVSVEASADEVMGVNSRAELAAAEAAWQQRARLQAMANGVTMIAPETIFLSHDTKFGRDTVIEPHVWIGPGVTVGEGVTIRAYSHIEGAAIADGAAVGPFARLRPGARIAAGARIGNFVEVKNATIGKGAKVNHLTYVGDANVGAGSNIGAGTITCNYDGFAKHHTEIGAGVFIGSNSALVAPVTIGDGAYVAAGSTITKDVEPDALAIARGRQETRPGGAGKLRTRIGVTRKPD
jgi:bifunctional UDP-N-acetylglucosamine pyrophosphorylase/glucosamine-1-phosphate N-acetyltransferase